MVPLRIVAHRGIYDPILKLKDAADNTSVVTREPFSESPAPSPSNQTNLLTKRPLNRELSGQFSKGSSKQDDSDGIATSSDEELNSKLERLERKIYTFQDSDDEPKVHPRQQWRKKQKEFGTEYVANNNYFLVDGKGPLGSNSEEVLKSFTAASNKGLGCGMAGLIGGAENYGNNSEEDIDLPEIDPKLFWPQEFDFVQRWMPSVLVGSNSSFLGSNPTSLLMNIVPADGTKTNSDKKNRKLSSGTTKTKFRLYNTGIPSETNLLTDPGVKQALGKFRTNSSMSTTANNRPSPYADFFLPGRKETKLARDPTTKNDSHIKWDRNNAVVNTDSKDGSIKTKGALSGGVAEMGNTLDFSKRTKKLCEFCWRDAKYRDSKTCQAFCTTACYVHLKLQRDPLSIEDGYSGAKDHNHSLYKKYCTGRE